MMKSSKACPVRLKGMIRDDVFSAIFPTISGFAISVVVVGHGTKEARQTNKTMAAREIGGSQIGFFREVLMDQDFCAMTTRCFSGY